MILKNSLYTIEGQQSQEGTVSYDIRLHSDHFIYQAHPLEHPQVRYTFRQIQDTPEAVTAQVDVADGDTSMTAISFTCA